MRHPGGRLLRRRRPFLCAVMRGITGNRDLAAVQVHDLAANTLEAPGCRVAPRSSGPPRPRSGGTRATPTLPDSRLWRQRPAAPPAPLRLVPGLTAAGTVPPIANRRPPYPAFTNPRFLSAETALQFRSERCSSPRSRPCPHRTDRPPPGRATSTACSLNESPPAGHSP